METGIGKRIKQRRKELGLSQQELADRMGLKSKSTICRVERGEDNLTTPIVKKYAKALGVDPSMLMEWNNTSTSDNTFEPEIIVELYKIFSPEELEDKETVADIIKAMQLYKAYRQASADSQSIVDLALKNPQQKP